MPSPDLTFAYILGHPRFGRTPGDKRILWETLDDELAGWPVHELQWVVVDGLSGPASEALHEWCRSREIAYVAWPLRSGTTAASAIRDREVAAAFPIHLIVGFGADSRAAQLARTAQAADLLLA